LSVGSAKRWIITVTYSSSADRVSVVRETKGRAPAKEKSRQRRPRARSSKEIATPVWEVNKPDASGEDLTEIRECRTQAKRECVQSDHQRLPCPRPKVRKTQPAQAGRSGFLPARAQSALLATPSRFLDIPQGARRIHQKKKAYGGHNSRLIHDESGGIRVHHDFQSTGC
jgi:hypothetical protein